MCRHLCKIHSYTDWHDVDENMMTVVKHGGSRNDNNAVGIAWRNLYHYSTDIFDAVASSNMKKMIIYYTDGHEVDEDMMTICTYNGWYNAGSWVGITLRYMVDTPTLASSDVALYVNINYCIW